LETVERDDDFLEVEEKPCPRTVGRHCGSRDCADGGTRRFRQCSRFAGCRAPGKQNHDGGPAVPVPHWHACDAGFQCATARVPLDYRHPRGTLINIAVIRHLATGPGRPVASLFVNGGGPAEQIQGFLADYAVIPAVLRDRSDLITFDPRGSGFSSPIQCFSSIAAENKLLAPVEPYATFPVGTRQTQVFERTYARFGTQCARRAGILLDHDTNPDEQGQAVCARLAWFRVPGGVTLLAQAERQPEKARASLGPGR
jgi:hypothetical protein